LRENSGPGVLAAYDERWRQAWSRLRNLRALPGAAPFVQRHAAQIAGCLPALGADLDSLAASLDLGF